MGRSWSRTSVAAPLAVCLTTGVASCAPVGGVSSAPESSSLLEAFTPAPPGSCRTVAAEPGNAGVAVEWRVPADAGEVAALDSWCAAVGPAVIRPAPASSAGHPTLTGRPVPDDVAIVSWNTHVGAGDVVRLVRDLQEGRLGDAVPRARYVLLLQEALRAGVAVPPLGPTQRLPRQFPTPQEGFDVESIARTLGASLAYAPSMRSSRRPEDRGVAVLASLPLDAVQIIELPLERQRRVLVTATIAARLVVASVHLDTAPGLTSGGPGAARLRQARAVAGALGRLPAPVVVGGDLNTWWGDDEPAVALLRRTFPDAEPLASRWTWMGPLGITAKLDYLFARTGGIPLPVRRLSDRYGSDHYPLIAVVPGALLD